MFVSRFCPWHLHACTFLDHFDECVWMWQNAHRIQTDTLRQQRENTRWSGYMIEWVYKKQQKRRDCYGMIFVRAPRVVCEDETQSKQTSARAFGAKEQRERRNENEYHSYFSIRPKYAHTAAVADYCWVGYLLLLLPLPPSSLLLVFCYVLVFSTILSFHTDRIYYSRHTHTHACVLASFVHCIALFHRVRLVRWFSWLLAAILCVSYMLLYTIYTVSLVWLCRNCVAASPCRSERSAAIDDLPDSFLYRYRARSVQ